MHIIFLTDNFPPEVNAPASRTFEHCSEWVRLGARVTVVTCAPNFPHGKLYEGYKNRLFQSEEMNGIRVIRLWSYITANEGFVKRTLDYMSFGFVAFWACLFQKFDVIIATSPQFFTTWAASAISKVRRKPWIFELRDLWPESIRTVGAMKQSRVLDVLEKIELWLYRDATKIVAVTDAFKLNLISRGIDAEKIAVVTNGSNLELFVPREKDPDLVRNLKLQGKFVVGYIGTHGMAHSLDFIVTAIGKLTDQDIHFLFIGDGAMKKTVVETARRLALENITFLDPIPKEDVPRFLSVTDVSLAPLKKSETFKKVIPSKIFEAAAMNKPTLLGVEGQAQEILERFDAGVCFKPEDEEDFLAKVSLLKSDKKLYSRKVQGCQKLAAAYDRKKLACAMLKIIRDSASLKTQ